MSKLDRNERIKKRPKVIGKSDSALSNPEGHGQTPFTQRPQYDCKRKLPAARNNSSSTIDAIRAHNTVLFQFINRIKSEAI